MPPRRDAEFVLNNVTDGGEELWDLIVDCMDWTRVLLEANIRHLTLDHGADESLYDMETHLCGECIAEALKQKVTYPNWKKGRS